MGLDNFASRSSEVQLLTEADRQAFADAGIELCGGLFSGDPGSFRGEMYDLLLLDITGVSPLQPWIPPETVQVMYDALVNCTPDGILKKYQQVAEDLEQEYQGATLEELTSNITQLRKFFGVCAERGLGLLGYY